MPNEPKHVHEWLDGLDHILFNCEECGYVVNRAARERLEELEAENAILREIADDITARGAAVGYPSYTQDSATYWNEIDNGYICCFCDGTDTLTHYEHTTECPVTRARVFFTRKGMP